MVFSDFEIIDSSSDDCSILSDTSYNEYEYIHLKRNGSCPDLKRVNQQNLTRKNSCPNFEIPEMNTWVEEQELLLKNWVDGENVAEVEPYWNDENCWNFSSNVNDQWVVNWEEEENWATYEFPRKKNDVIHFDSEPFPEDVKKVEEETICDKVCNFFLNMIDTITNFFSNLFY